MDLVMSKIINVTFRLGIYAFILVLVLAVRLNLIANDIGKDIKNDIKIMTSSTIEDKITTVGRNDEQDKVTFETDYNSLGKMLSASSKNYDYSMVFDYLKSIRVYTDKDSNLSIEVEYVPWLFGKSGGYYIAKVKTENTENSKDNKIYLSLKIYTSTDIDTNTGKVYLMSYSNK